MTKEHVNAVATGMSAGMTSYADASTQVVAPADPESRQAGRASTSGRRSNRP